MVEPLQRCDAGWNEGSGLSFQTMKGTRRPGRIHGSSLWN